MKIYPFILNKSYHEWMEPFISLADLKKLGKLTSEDRVYWKVQGQDEEITNENPLDLARLGVEQVYSICGEKYEFIVNERLFVSNEPFVTEEEIRKVGHIPANNLIFFKVEGPDREVKKGQKVDLRPYPIEEFYSVSEKLVTITIDKTDYPIKPGKHSVAELRKLGKVKEGYDFNQLIDGKLVLLKDDAYVIIKGCEVFKSCPPDGSSS